MIAVASVILAALVVGWPAASLAGVRGIGGLRAGTSFLLGSGVVAGSLMLLSLLGIPWSRTSFLLVFVILAALLWWLSLRRSGTSDERTQSPIRFGALSIAADLATAALVAGHGLYASVAAPFETDFISIWGLKGRVFAVNEGIDWAFLASPWNFFSHPDYPLLLPLLFDAVAVMNGGWEDRWLGIFTTAFGASALLAIRGLLQRELSSGYAAVITFGVASMVLSPWIGMAEAGMIAYGCTSLLFLRSALRDSGAAASTDWNAGAWLLVCAAMTKNEGAALVIAVAAGIIVVARGRRLRSLIRILPAVAFVGGWRIVQWLFALENDLTTGSPLLRVANADLPQMVRLLWEHGGQTIPWLGFLLAAVLVGPRLIRQERFLLVAILVQLGFYLAAYLITPNDIEWQIRWSWGRLITHLLPLVALALLIPLARFMTSEAEVETAGTAVARC